MKHLPPTKLLKSEDMYQWFRMPYYPRTFYDACSDSLTVLDVCQAIKNAVAQAPYIYPNEERFNGVIRLLRDDQILGASYIRALSVLIFKARNLVGDYLGWDLELRNFSRTKGGTVIFRDILFCSDSIYEPNGDNYEEEEDDYWDYDEDEDYEYEEE